GRRVWLDPRTEVTLRADATARERIENLAADGDQFFVAEQLDNAADDVARQTGHDLTDGCFAAFQQTNFQFAERKLCSLGGRLPLETGPQQTKEFVVEWRVGIDLVESRRAQ